MVTHLRSTISRSPAALAIAALLVVASAPVLSHSGIGGPAVRPDPATREAHIREPMQARLERMATRLEISASQQPAWAEYVGAIQSLRANRPARPPASADAVTLLRFGADTAARRAQTLTQIADATAKLALALTPDQRKARDEVVRHRRFAPMRHRG